MSYNHDYYIKHRERILENNRKWREQNKKKFAEIVYNYRKYKAEELTKQGERYCWHSDIKRKELYEERNKRINKRIRKRKIQNNNDE